MMQSEIALTVEFLVSKTNFRDCGSSGDSPSHSQRLVGRLALPDALNAVRSVADAAFGEGHEGFVEGDFVFTEEGDVTATVEEKTEEASAVEFVFVEP